MFIKTFRRICRPLTEYDMADNENENENDIIDDAAISEDETQESSSGSETVPGDEAETPNGSREQALTGELLNPNDIRPPRVMVIPVFGRPFLPGQLLPVQIAAKPWAQTVKAVLDTPHRMLAMFCVSNEDESINEKNILDHLPKTGTLVRIVHARINENEIMFIAEGVCRVNVSGFISKSRPPYLVEAGYPQDENASGATKTELKAYGMSIIAAVKELISTNRVYGEEIKQFAHKFNPNKPNELADCAASLTTATGEEIQKILDESDVLSRMKLTLEYIKKELEICRLQNTISESIDEKARKQQRDYYLHEQLKAIQKELGIALDDKTSDLNTFQEKMDALDPPKHVLEKFDAEMAKLKVLETGSAEYGVTRNYLDWLTQVPWGTEKEESTDLEHARKVLEKDHDGLEDVKERIVEFVAVGHKKGSVNGSIILFVGPPGVGKTSVGKSIAKALDRPFFRFSVGGLRDEAEIKGHRRTYIGAMPGKLVSALKQTKCMNPIIMLDEIDKITNGNWGDPSSALLEALDPEQNSEFHDHYLDLNVDLSKCLFICTANSTETIPAPLLDRMEVISLSGYLTQEKLAIAKHHLLPNILKNSGLKPKAVSMSDKVIKQIIEDYAREAGVRHLEKLLSKIVRKAVVKMIDQETETVAVQPEDLKEYLKSPRFRKDDELKGVGVATGLAWTSMGGATIPVEAIRVNNLAAGMQLTGSLGDVMKESASLAYSYVCANAGKFEKSAKHYFDKAKIHLHVPEGATPKDGPSAGITMATALLSLAIGKAPARGFAMTGELTLTGKVLAIGGIKEKTLAAKRLGIKKLICPLANESDVADLPEFVTKGVEYHYADTYEDVAKLLFPTLFKDNK